MASGPTPLIRPLPPLGKLSADEAADLAYDEHCPDCHERVVRCQCGRY